MSSWKLAPCLSELFAEFDRIAPSRDHASDGSIGDAAHQAEDSDHNPDKNGFVCAIDVDNDLHASFSMEDVIQYFVSECKKSNDVGKDRGRLNYFIYNRRIWRADGGWKQEAYTGASAHTEHAHFSCEHDLTYVNDSHPWGLIERFGSDLVTSQAEFDTLMINSLKNPAVVDALLSNVKVTDYASTATPQPILNLRQWLGYSEGRRQVNDAIAAIQQTDAHVLRLTELIQQHASGLIEGQSEISR